MKSQNRTEAPSDVSQGAEFNWRSQVCGDVGTFTVRQAAIKQEHLKKRTTAKTAPQEQTVEETQTPQHKTGEELKAELDDLLDEIDGVLEENAEEFVRSYVQKGGE